MPVISVDVLPGRSRQQKRDLAERITTRFAATCGVERSTVRVIVREVVPGGDDPARRRSQVLP